MLVLFMTTEISPWQVVKKVLLKHSIVITGLVYLMEKSIVAQILPFKICKYKNVKSQGSKLKHVRSYHGYHQRFSLRLSMSLNRPVEILFAE